MNAEEVMNVAGSLANLLKELANKNRILILCTIFDKERTVSEIVSVLGVSQSAVSQHLSRMKHQNILGTRRDGKEIYYRITNDDVNRIISFMHSVFCSKVFK